MLKVKALLFSFSQFSESILEIDSLEPDLILDDNDEDEEQFDEDSIRPVPPDPVWPSTPQQPKTNFASKIDKDVNYVTKISYEVEDETPDSLEINRNGHFVKSIQWRNHNRVRPLMGSSMLRTSRVPRMLETGLSPIGEYYLHSLEIL